MLKKQITSNVGHVAMASKVQVPYQVNKGFKPIIKPEIGQWWLYRDSKDWDWPKISKDIKGLKPGLKQITDKRICVIVITNVITGPYGGEEVKVAFMVADDTYSPYKLHSFAWFVDQNFSIEEGYFVPFWVRVDGIVYQITKSIRSQY